MRSSLFVILPTEFWGERSETRFTLTATLPDTAGNWIAATVLDLAHVIEHELGHVLGMDDVYDSGAEQNLMYGIMGRPDSSIKAPLNLSFGIASLSLLGELSADPVDGLMSTWGNDDFADMLFTTSREKQTAKLSITGSANSGTTDLAALLSRLRGDADGESNGDDANNESDGDALNLLTEARR